MSTGPENRFSDAALAYARRGWRVFPLKPRSKEPLIKWKDGATTDHDTIRTWWSKWPDANVAIGTGLESGVVVIDVDQTDIPVRLPATLMSRSGSRGFHMFYTHPGNGPLRNLSKNVRPGVDRLKADGGYIVAPPSVHPDTGRAYRWINDADPVSLPEDIGAAARVKELGVQGGVRFAEHTSPYGLAALKAEAESVADTPEGERNNTLNIAAFKLGGLVAGGEIARDDAEAALLRAGLHCGLDEDEVIPTLNSGLAAGMKHPRQAPPEAEDIQERSSRRQSPSDTLVELAGAAELFHTPDQKPYARLSIEAHNEIWPLRQKTFQRWLQRRYYEEKGKAPGSQSVQDALGVLEGKALFGGSEREVHVRIAQDNGNIYLDLGNARWEMVKVSAQGYEIVSDGPAFRRPKGLAPLPHPQSGGSIDDLRPFVNVGDNDWPLLLGALVAYLKPQGPYPIVNLLGNQGSAKSTTTRVIRRLVDPAMPELQHGPRDVRDLMIAATNGWIVTWDNLSGFRDWLSDAVCRLATGGGFATRELYSDDEQTLFDVCRPVIVNGIGDIGTRGDYLDRSLVLYAPEIPSSKRIDEKQFWAAFEKAHPRILGALLDAVSCALGRVDQVHLEELPRMADLAIWATAAEPALGLGQGTFVASYASNLEAANEIVLEASPVGAVLEIFLHEVGPGDKAWEGTATQLLKRLNELASEEISRQRDWPKSPSALGTVMRRIAPSLGMRGIKIDFDRRAGRQRTIKLQRVEKTSSSVSSPSSSSSELPGHMTPN